MITNLRKEGNEGAVTDNDLVISVVDDESELLWKQPDVQRVEYCAHRRHGQVGLHVLLVVPHECAHTVAIRNTQFGQGLRQLFGTLGNLEKGALLHAIGVHGKYLLVPIQPLPVAHHVANEQWCILHRAEHFSPFDFRCYKTTDSEPSNSLRRAQRAVEGSLILE